MKIIYGDLLFLVNFSMDYIGLLITSRLIGRRPRGVKLIVASAIGAAFGVCSCFMSERVYIYLLGLAVCLTMCFCAFGESFGVLFSSSVVYVCVSTLLGGVMTALYTIVGGSFEASASSSGMALFSVVSAFAFFIGSVFSKILNRSAKAKYEDVIIEEKGKKLRIKAVLDSGNFLCDTAGRRAIVVKLKSVREILPAALTEAALSGDPSDIAKLNLKVGVRVSLLFANTPTGKKMMLGYRPDAVTVKGRRCNCVLALDVSDCDFGDADCIISDKIAA